MAAGTNPRGIAVSPNQPPIALLTAPSQARAGSPVAFDASASKASAGEIASYRFDFGEGTVAEGPSPTRNHTFSAPGTYEATVTVDDGVGCPEPAFAGLASLFTGQTAYCNGPSVVTSQAHTITVTEPEGRFSLSLALERPRLPLRTVGVKATCRGSDCELTASGAIQVRTSGKRWVRSFRLPPATRALAADQPARLALRVPARVRRAARSALREGRRVIVVARARATSGDRVRAKASRARLRR